MNDLLIEGSININRGAASEESASDSASDSAEAWFAAAQQQPLAINKKGPEGRRVDGASSSLTLLGRVIVLFGGGLAAFGGSVALVGNLGLYGNDDGINERAYTIGTLSFYTGTMIAIGGGIIIACAENREEKLALRGVR